MTSKEEILDKKAEILCVANGWLLAFSIIGCGVMIIAGLLDNGEHYRYTPVSITQSITGVYCVIASLVIYYIINIYANSFKYDSELKNQ